jgi:hypothetical protein
MSLILIHPALAVPGLALQLIGTARLIWLNCTKPTPEK